MKKVFGSKNLWASATGSCGLLPRLKLSTSPSMVVTAGVYLLSGVFYPVSALPGWLQVGSWVLHHTYALEALRLTLLQGASLSQVAPQLGALVLFTIGILPLSFLLFRYAVRRGKVEGSFAL